MSLALLKYQGAKGPRRDSNPHLRADWPGALPLDHGSFASFLIRNGVTPVTSSPHYNDPPAVAAPRLVLVAVAYAVKLTYRRPDPFYSMSDTFPEEGLPYSFRAMLHNKHVMCQHSLEEFDKGKGILPVLFFLFPVTDVVEC